MMLMTIQITYEVGVMVRLRMAVEILYSLRFNINLAKMYQYGELD